MRISAARIEETASYTLQNLDSFIQRAGSGWRHPHNIPASYFENYLATSQIDATEGLIGIYFNSGDSVLIITATGIHLVNGATKTFVPYDSIADIAQPSAVDQDIDLSLEEGACIALPIVNSTNELLDINAFYEFLSSIIILRSQKRKKLEDIENLNDFVEFFRETRNGTYIANLADSLESGTVKRLCEQLRIDPDLLERGETWRLAGLLFEIALPSDD